MKIKVNDNYEVQTDSNGYMTRKRSGTQWKVVSHHSTLKDAMNSVFETSVRGDTDEFIVDFTNIATLHADKAGLIKKIESIRDEILEGLSWNEK